MACCAVGGYDFPGRIASGTNAQSPTAHTPGQPGTPKNWFTNTRPHSFAQGREETNGLGTVPAVHTKVLAGIDVPPVRKISFSVMLVTRVFRQISTPRRERAF